MLWNTYWFCVLCLANFFMLSIFPCSLWRVILLIFFVYLYFFLDFFCNFFFFFEVLLYFFYVSFFSLIFSFFFFLLGRLCFGPSCSLFTPSFSFLQPNPCSPSNPAQAIPYYLPKGDSAYTFLKTPKMVPPLIQITQNYNWLLTYPQISFGV